jgi:protein CpxP
MGSVQFARLSRKDINMLNIKKACIGGLLALTIGSTALGAFADAPAPGLHHRGPTPEMMAKFKAKMEKRQEAFHAKLKLTSAQEPAWKTFIASAKPPQRNPAAQRPDRDAWEKLSTPERMEKHLAGMQARQQFETARLNDVKTFYAVLTPAQKKTFDTEFAHFGHHGHHGRHHQHRGHGDQRDDRRGGPDHGPDSGPAGAPAKPDVAG